MTRQKAQRLLSVIQRLFRPVGLSNATSVAAQEIDRTWVICGTGWAEFRGSECVK